MLFFADWRKMLVGQSPKSQPEFKSGQLNKWLEESVNILGFEGQRSVCFDEWWNTWARVTPVCDIPKVIDDNEVDNDDMNQFLQAAFSLYLFFKYCLS